VRFNQAVGQQAAEVRHQAGDGFRGLDKYNSHRQVFPRVADWDSDPVPPRRARMAGGLALALWAAMIVSGRMIAYDWFDCSRQPQSALVNLLQGCRTESH